MRCPICHQENKYDNLACDYCMSVLPMSKEREAEIKKRRKIEKKARFSSSITKIIGMLFALGVIVGIILIVYFF